MQRILLQFALVTSALAIAGCDRNNNASVSGTIETDEVRVASRYGGRVEKIFAWEGESLTNRQVLIRVEAPELRAQRDQAAANLDELIAGPRKEEIATAKADWESQKANLDYARKNAKRAEELFVSKTIAEADRDLAVSKASALEKTVESARSRYDLLLAGTRPEEIAQARAKLAEIETRLAEMQIVAPSNCILEVLSVEVGDVLAANQEVATLLLSEHIWVRVYVPEPWLGHIKLGDAVKVRVDSFPGKDFPGTVEQIARAAEFTPRNVQTVGERVKQVFGIKVRLDNREDRLRAGMSADVLFQNLPR